MKHTHSPLPPRVRVAAALLLLAASASSAAQGAYVPLEQRFSPEQMRQTGLDRLSASELALLNRLLGEERATAVDQARNQARQEAAAATPPAAPVAAERPSREPVEARVQGRFNGWSTGTRLVLDNGQVWQVIEGSLATSPSDSPAVRITRAISGAWYLQVEGRSPRAKVRRIE